MLQTLFSKSKLVVHSLSIFIIYLLSNTVIASPVDDYFWIKMKEEHIPGLQVVISKNGKVVKVASYGVANVQDAVKVDDKTVFNQASITKAFTSVAVMQLVEEGKGREVYQRLLLLIFYSTFNLNCFF